MAKGLGLHLEKDFVVVAYMDCRIGHSELLALYVIFDHDLSVRRKKLKKILRQLQSSLNHVSFSLSGREALWRKFNVPYTENDHISQIIHYETEKYIKTQQIEDLIVDYHVLTRKENNTRLLAAAARKEYIQEQLDWVESCNLFPLFAEIDIMALVHTVKMYENPETGPVLVVELHNTHCNILLFEENTPIMTRSIPLVFDSFVDGLSKGLDDTVQLKLEDLKPGGQSQKNIFQRLTPEVKKTLLHASEPARIFLCGNHHLVCDFQQYLAAKSSIETQIWDLSKYLPNDHIAAADYFYAPVAVGLALKACRETEGGYNFRKDDFVYRQSFHLLQKPLAIFISLLFLLICLALAFTVKPLHRERKQYEKIIACVDALHKRIEPGVKWHIDDKEKITALLKLIEQKIAEQPEEIPNGRDMLLTWQEIFQKLALVRQEYYFTIDILTIKNDGVVIAGLVEREECFDLWKKHLRRIAWLSHDNALQLMYCKPLEYPKDKRLNKEYRYVISWKKERW